MTAIQIVRKDSPQRAIVFFQIKTTNTTDNFIVNSIVKRGCCGLVFMEDIAQLTPSGAICQLVENVYERFPGISFRFVKTTGADITEEYEIVSLETCGDISRGDEDIVVVCCSDIDMAQLDLQTVTNWINDDNRMICLLKWLDNPIEKQREFYTAQSFEFKEGNRISIVKDWPLLACWTSKHSTRIDKTQEFTVDNVQNNGANGGILAYHYLAEIGYILGKTKKFGA